MRRETVESIFIKRVDAPILDDDCRARLQKSRASLTTATRKMMRRGTSIDSIVWVMTPRREEVMTIDRFVAPSVDLALMVRDMNDQKPNAPEVILAFLFVGGLVTFTWTKLGEVSA